MSTTYEVEIFIRKDETFSVSELVANIATLRHWHEAHEAHRQVAELSQRMEVYDTSDLLQQAEDDLQELLGLIVRINDVPMLRVDIEDTPCLPFDYELYCYEDRLRLRKHSILSGDDQHRLYVDALTLNASILRLGGGGHVEIPYEDRKIWVDFHFWTIVDNTIYAWQSTRTAQLVIEDVAYADDLPEGTVDDILDNFFNPTAAAVS